MTPTPPIRLLVHGAKGRMGARICALARDDSRFNLVAAIDRDDHAQADALRERSIDSIIDFSSEEGAPHAVKLALRHHAALLVGTTGLSSQALATIASAASSVPVMVAANTSLGVAVLNHLIAEAARLLGPAFNIDLIEHHHTAKKDAPSGTALRLVQTLKDKAGVVLPAERVHAVRAGDIIGDHVIEFAGPGERIRVGHFATTRDVFVHGALRAAAWLAGKPAGRYTIEQSLGLGA
jgi:4-hydroxy-tetrahydrodipicolinate reductase